MNLNRILGVLILIISLEIYENNITNNITNNSDHYWGSPQPSPEPNIIETYSILMQIEYSKYNLILNETKIKN